PAVPPTSSAHLCPAVRPLALPTCAQQCTHLCPAPSSAASQCHHQCRQSVPSSDASQCRLSVPIISVAYQCCILVPPIRATSLVLPISAHQCRLSISALSVLSLINAHQ
ncbi:unnamed protein product, partial [Staurois parvus]